MTSRVLRSALAALALASCSTSLHDASVAADPLLVINGHVDLSKLTRVHPDAPLIGLLVWASIPRINPICLKYAATPELQSACPDPYGVYYGEIEKAAPVDADGNLHLELFSLPNARVSVGNSETRIAYGSLLVVEDVNGDGQLSLPTGSGNRGGDGGGGGDGGDGGGRGGNQPKPKPPDPDVVLGASFSTLRAAQQRVVFREGGFVEDSKFYPAPGCGTPPPGFSILVAPPYSLTNPDPAKCHFEAATTSVEITPISQDEALTLECRTIQQGFGAQQPQEDDGRRLGKDVIPVCLSHELLGVVTPGICARVETWTLKGCRQDPFCETPDWDLTETPPTWWPCP